LTFATITATILLASMLLHDGIRPDQDLIAFKTWMARHGKTYTTETEFAYRLNVYKKNAVYVAEHNARHAAGLETFDLEMNLFADMEINEFADKYTMRNFQATTKCTGGQAPTNSLPDAVDWSTKGAVTPIKNQGQCGSCWAFSTTGSLEGVNFLKNKNLLSFSEQQLVDCSTKYGNHGCNGGLMDDAFYYVIDNGITLESKYTYRGIDGSCHYNESSDKAFQITNCVDITVNKELALRASIAQQPVSVAIDAAHASFQLYKSGVYSGLCGTNLDHGVLAVGYGAESGKSFFKVKNSWGASWGSNGFIYIANKGDGKGQCGIQMAASFPIA